MTVPFFYALPVWLNALVFFAVLYGTFEISYRLGLWRRRTGKARDMDRRGDIVLTAMLGFLGLMLGFTYAFTITRSDRRKSAVLEEVNALGTAFLRADLVKEPQRTGLRRALLDYTRTRFITTQNARTSDRLKEALRRTLKEQARIWVVVKSLIETTGSPGPLEVSVVQSINDVLDAHTTRVTAGFDFLPGAILFMLLFVAATSLAVAGYSEGRADALRRWRITVLTLVLTSVLMVIVDFDRSHDGFVTINQQGYLSLIEDMEQALAP